MFVKVLDGLYAGEIREFDPAIAKELIARGRALNPYADPPAVAAAAPDPQPAPTQIVNKPAAKSSKRSR